MKKILFFIIVLSQLVFPQTRRVSSAWDVYFAAGYGISNTSSLSGYYDYLCNFYIAHGIPLQTQTKFSKTAILNAGVMYGFLKDFSAGISLGYMHSPAYTNYEDDNGTLKINGSLNIFYISGMIRYTPYKIFGCPIILRSQVGICSASSNITGQIRFITYALYNEDWNVSLNDVGIFFQGSIGTSFKFGGFNLGLEAGYAYSYIKFLPEGVKTKLGVIADPRVVDNGPQTIILLASVGFQL